MRINIFILCYINVIAVGWWGRCKPVVWGDGGKLAMTLPPQRASGRDNDCVASLCVCGAPDGMPSRPFCRWVAVLRLFVAWFATTTGMGEHPEWAMIRLCSYLCVFRIRAVLLTSLCARYSLQTHRLTTKGYREWEGRVNSHTHRDLHFYPRWERFAIVVGFS